VFDNKEYEVTYRFNPASVRFKHRAASLSPKRRTGFQSCLSAIQTCSNAIASTQIHESFNPASVRFKRFLSSKSLFSIDLFQSCLSAIQTGTASNAWRTSWPVSILPQCDSNMHL